LSQNFSVDFVKHQLEYGQIMQATQ